MAGKRVACLHGLETAVKNQLHEAHLKKKGLCMAEAKQPQAETVQNSAITQAWQFRPTPMGAFKLRQACEYLGGLSIPTMHRLIKRGLLRPNRATRHLLFPVSELDRFLRET